MTRPALNLFVLAAALLAGAACAAATPPPPESPIDPSSIRVVQSYLRRIRVADAAGAAALFAPEARVRSPGRRPESGPDWLSRFFVEERGHVRILHVFDRAEGASGAAFLIVEEATVADPCAPPEPCPEPPPPRYASELVTVRAGRIVDVERSADFSGVLTPAGTLP